MLSVLIPTYNYPTFKLAKDIHGQCEELKIIFEILVSEDGGNQFLEINRKINELSHASYIENTYNKGRVGNKNLLLKKSKFELKLLLDSDVFPSSRYIISKYLDFSKKHTAFACFGGITYETKNSSTNSLRYNYGIKRESKDAETRSQDPFKLFLTSNTLLKNCDLRFEEKITHYGFEEIVFAENLKNKNIPVFHIDNTVIHENLESNQTFIDKITEGLRTLIFLEKSKIIDKGKNKVSKLYHMFAKLYLTNLLRWFFQLSEKIILKQLINKGRPLWLFDLYRLLYFSKNY